MPARANASCQVGSRALKKALGRFGDLRYILWSMVMDPNDKCPRGIHKVQANQSLMTRIHTSVTNHCYQIASKYIKSVVPSNQIDQF